MPKKEPSREFKVGDKIRANLHRGKIDEVVVNLLRENPLQQHLT